MAPTAKKSVNVNVRYVTRVEGHGNIVVNVKDGQLEKCELDIVEAPRFFEAMLLGRRWDEVSLITSRICGICAVGHASASVLATEDAMGIKNSIQTERLRRLNVYGETIQSHVLHVYFLAAPDFLGVGSVVPLVQTHPDVVLRALKLKKLANDICGIISGRKVHPISMTPGGFTHIPTAAEILSIKERILDCVPDVVATVDLVAALAPKLPNFTRETEYEALYCPDEYALYRGTKLITTDGAECTNRDYKKSSRKRSSPIPVPSMSPTNAPASWSGRWPASTTIGNSFTPRPSKLPPSSASRPPAPTPSTTPSPRWSRPSTALTRPWKFATSCSLPASRTKSPRSRSRPGAAWA
jgi:coenzyme F420-reducing hydrogenase alpha subunit